MVWKLQENILEKSDADELADFLHSNARLTQSAKVREFEAAWSQWQGCKYSVYVNSGSSANLIIMNLMKELRGWSDGDEVIVPMVTWVTNISPVFQCGLRPVFVDVNLDDLSFDYGALEKKITPRTRAIFVTHLIGFPADITRIKAIVGDRKIDIMEDCCESHGAMTGGTKAGNGGACSSFSFYWGHHMTTIEGGMICTNDEAIYKLAILKRSHGLARELPEQYHASLKQQYPAIDFNFLFLTDGFNFRNTELHAVLGLTQLKRLDGYIATRNANYEAFAAMMKPYKDFVIVPELKGTSSFCLPFILRNTADKAPLQDILNKAGIESRPIISGNLMQQPFLAAYKTDDCHNAEFLHENGFYIGNNQFVNEERLGALKGLVEKFFTR